MPRRKLPEVVKGLKGAKGYFRTAADTSAKRHAENLKAVIIEGIKKQNLVTPPLKESTVRSKRAKGMSRPKTPLWGKGDLMESLRVYKTKTGYRLTPAGQHPSGLSNQGLWKINEFGANISNGFGKGIHIRIPARFPMKKGVNRYNKSAEKEKALKEFMKEIRRRVGV